MALADDIATKQDIEISDFELCSKACFGHLCCFSCAVVNECKVYRNIHFSDDIVPQAMEMDDR